MSHELNHERPVHRPRRWLRVVLAVILAALGIAAASVPSTSVFADAPPAPTNLRAAMYPDPGIQRGQVTLSWDGAADTFDASYSPDRSEFSWKGLGQSSGQTGTTATVFLRDGATYYFRVRACGPPTPQPTGPPLRECSAWSELQATLPTFPPGAPVLSAAVVPTEGVMRGEVRLSWPAPADGGTAITDYVIERSTAGTSWTTEDDGVSTATTFTVAGLTTGTQYSFRAKARNSVGDGEWSKTVTATPPKAPSPPRALIATVAPDDGVGSGQAKLSWTAPASDGGAPITDYEIGQSADNGQTWTTVDDGVSTATSFTVRGLEGGRSYRFRVRAVNVAGAGFWLGVQADVTATPSMPTAVTATVYPTPRSLAGAVKLSWLASNSGGTAITDYTVQTSTDGTTWRTVDDGVSTTSGLIVAGLTNGTRYWLRVAATNAIGTGPWSDPITATPVGPASAPNGLLATAAPADGVGSGQVKLTWTVPADDGGTPILDYEISFAGFTPDWVVWDDGVSTATTATVSGLSNGFSYTFRVYPKTAVGFGKNALVSATPLGAPNVAPKALTAAVAPAPGAESGQVKLTWTAGMDTSAAPPTDYVIEISPDGQTWTTMADGVSTDTSYTVGGLANGTPYWFRVTTVNPLGAGPATTPVQAVPVWLPAAPELRATTAPAQGVGSGQVQLAWDAPADNGSALTDYLIEMSPDGDTWTVIDDGVSHATTYTVGGLTNGTDYEFRVAAVNAVGSSQPSLAAAATPVWTPGAPDRLTAAVPPADGLDSGQIRLSWAPANDSGSAITDYLIESSIDGETWNVVDDDVSTATTYTVGGLTIGSGYQFRVTAVNAVGNGPASAAITAIPVWTPAAPDGLTATVAPAAGVGSGQVKLTWTPPIDNGSTITDYLIQRSVDGTTWTVVDDGVSTATTSTVRALSNGRSYRFRIAAVNAVGQGAWSSPVQATPRWKPTAPRGLRTSSPGSRRVKLTWNAPSSSNGAAITDYIIQRSNGSRWTTVRDGVSTTRSATITPLTNGTAYRFRVAAKNAVGVGPWTTAVRATARAG